MTELRLNVDASLEAVRARAIAHADRRVNNMQRQLWLDGRRDRAAMGNPDPSLADAFRPLGEAARTMIGFLGTQHDYAKAR